MKGGRKRKKRSKLKKKEKDEKDAEEVAQAEVTRCEQKASASEEATRRKVSESVILLQSHFPTLNGSLLTAELSVSDSSYLSCLIKGDVFSYLSSIIF